MKIGSIASYDEPLKKIKVSVNLLDYMSLGYRNHNGIEELRKLPGKQYYLNKYGHPESKGINSLSVRAYTGRLFELNQALALALKSDSRGELNQELRNFRLLNKDPRLPETIETEQTEKEQFDKRRKESLKNKDNPESTFDFSELGSEMDTSAAAIAFRDMLGTKRRETNEFYTMRRFIFPLAMIGLHCADPAYTATILSANDFGIKHNDPEVRLASTAILGEDVRSIWLKFQMARKFGNLPVLKDNGNESLLSLITFTDLKDDLASLQTINSTITQDHYGVNDRDSDVQDLAETTAQNSIKAQRMITSYCQEQGYAA